MSSCADVAVERFKGSLRLAGTVTQDGVPAWCYVRLLDRNHEFVAELRADQTGSFAFFAIPGDWTLRLITSQGSTDTPVRLVDTDVEGLALTI